eukprot:COSAG02_NODE_1977_length_10205_cov_5.317633_7_plen_51_part_00
MAATGGITNSRAKAHIRTAAWLARGMRWGAGGDWAAEARSTKYEARAHEI